MIVHIPSPLRSYTRDKTPVEVSGKTLNALLKNLDKQFPGFLFRIIDEQGEIREHIQRGWCLATNAFPLGPRA